MSLLAQLRKAWFMVAHHGFVELLRAIRDYAQPREYAVYRRALTDAEPGAPPVAAVSEGSLPDLRRWRDGQGHVAPPFLGDRKAGWSDFCWAWGDGQPVGIVWTTARSPLLLTDADEAAIVDLYTSPAFRGRGIALALIAAACRYLRQRGVRTVYATVETRNTPSRRAFARSGFEVVGEFGVRGWLRHPPRTTHWMPPTGAGGSR